MSGSLSSFSPLTMFRPSSVRSATASATGPAAAAAGPSWPRRCSRAACTMLADCRRTRSAAIAVHLTTRKWAGTGPTASVQSPMCARCGASRDVRPGRRVTFGIVNGRVPRARARRAAVGRSVGRSFGWASGGKSVGVPVARVRMVRACVRAARVIPERVCLVNGTSRDDCRRTIDGRTVERRTRARVPSSPVPRPVNRRRAYRLMTRPPLTLSVRRARARSRASVTLRRVNVRSDGGERARRGGVAVAVIITAMTFRSLMGYGWFFFSFQRPVNGTARTVGVRTENPNVKKRVYRDAGCRTATENESAGSGDECGKRARKLVIIIITDNYR